MNGNGDQMVKQSGAKRAYHKPVLQDFGALHLTTRGSGGGDFDALGGGKGGTGGKGGKTK